MAIESSRSQSPKDRARQVKRHLNLKLLPMLVVALGLVYGLTGYKGWLVFFTGTAGAWLVGWLWTYSLERNLRIERKIHLPWATVGESVPEQIKLINNGWLPAQWVEITEESPALESPLRMVSDVAHHASRTRHLNHLFKRRGVYTLGPTHLRCGDPLGIYTITLNDLHVSTILVTPPILPLSQLRIPSGGWGGDERHRRGYIERNISDAGLRNYVAGDSLKRIHWRASAHFDNLVVRQLETATSRDWWIFVDLDRDEQAGTGEQSTLELSIVLAASLALRGLREYRKVGIVLAGPQVIRLQPASDPTQGWRILRALAVAQAGEHSLSDLYQLGRINQTGTAIMITPSTNPSWVASAARQRSSSMMAVLVDPADFGKPQGQNQVISALAHNRIPYTRMPGMLLEQAYAASSQARRRQISASEVGKRYSQQGRQSWQSMK